MKKILSFILGSLLSCSIFTGTALAVPGEQMTIQTFGDFLIKEAKKISEEESMRISREKSTYMKNYATIAAKMAEDHGLTPTIANLNYSNGESDWVVIVYNGKGTFVCDYYNVICHLSKSRIEDVSKNWSCIPFENYLDGKALSSIYYYALIN